MRQDEEKRKKSASSADDPLAEAVVTLAMEAWQQDIADQLDEEPAAEEHRFSEQHQAELEAFFADLRRDEQRDERRKRIRRWASVAALLLLCVLPLSVEASRSVIIRVVQQLGQDFMQFFFLQEETEMDLPLADEGYWQLTMKPGYLPDGFAEQKAEADIGRIIYLGPENTYIIFSGVPASGHAPSYDRDDYRIFERQSDRLGTYWAFESLDPTKGQILVWIDHDTEVIYDLYGYASLDELTKMAESLVALDP